MPAIASISHSSKGPDNNEDFAGASETTFVVADGSTDKSGQMYDGQTGGYIASRLVVEKCLASNVNSQELADELSQALAELYQKINPRALEDGKYRFECSVVCARLQGQELVVTQIGDVAFRMNGEKVYLNDKLIDELSSNARAEYIERTGDVEGGRKFIWPILENQHQFANTTDFPLSYGVVNGLPTPPQFVKTFTFPVSEVKTLEMFSDGYFDVANEVSLESWEEMYRRIEQEDPGKYKKYKSPKPTDDRTVMIVKF